MTSNVRMILNEVNARIKLAEAKLAEDPSNFDSFPGAENDKTVPAETKSPDPEVKDEGPASRTETTGATPGSDDKVNQDHLYEADEPVLTPEKKPADSADANAKVASAKVDPDVTKVAADIMSIIKDNLSKKATENKEKDAGCCKKSVCGKNSACGKSSECGKKDCGKGEGCKGDGCKAEKRATDDMINLGAKIMDKIASARSENMAKEAGARDAIALIKQAEEYRNGAADAEALIMKLAQALEESANSGDAAEMCDGTPEAAGAADAEAAIADAAAAADVGSEGVDGADAGMADDPVTPEEVAQAVTELVDEGQISDEEAATLVEQLSGGEDAATDATGDISEDELAQGIAQAIDSGEITEDEAQQLVQELISAGADESIKDEVSDPAAAAAVAEESAPATAAGDTSAADPAAAAEAAGADDAAQAIEDTKQAEAKLNKKASLISQINEKLTKKAEEDQIARYQQGFIRKCAEYGVDPQAVAQYIQAKNA